MAHGKTGGSVPEPPPFHSFNVQDDCGIMWGILQAAGNPNAVRFLYIFSRILLLF